MSEREKAWKGVREKRHDSKREGVTVRERRHDRVREREKHNGEQEKMERVK